MKGEKDLGQIYYFSCHLLTALFVPIQLFLAGKKSFILPTRFANNPFSVFHLGLFVTYVYMYIHICTYMYMHIAHARCP
jgi:lysylphosphatidylglycerol synthetase-like protein (DUF2156 family)